MRALCALIASAALGGCASFSYIGETYGALPPQAVTTKVGTWQVIDRAAEGKVLVQRTQSTASSIASGLGLSKGNAAAPQPEYQEAAEAFLAQSGRSACKIKDGYLVVAPSWEFTYQCDGAAPDNAAPAAKKT